MELLTLMETHPRILPYLDIPFQHASVPVLRKMGRSGDAQTYLDLIAEIRDRLPNSVIRSTFLVGHPGEGHREFEELRRFQEAGSLDWAPVFFLGHGEEGTSAAKEKSGLAARLGTPTAERRRKAIEERQLHISGRRLDRWKGHRLDVLIEEPIANEERALGRAFFQAPEVDGCVVVHAVGENSKEFRSGDVVKVRITGRTGLDLQGAWDG